jgi:hypothetical protein
MGESSVKPETIDRCFRKVAALWSIPKSLSKIVRVSVEERVVNDELETSQDNCRRSGRRTTWSTTWPWVKKKSLVEC